MSLSHGFLRLFLLFHIPVTATYTERNQYRLLVLIPFHTNSSSIEFHSKLIATAVSHFRAKWMTLKYEVVCIQGIPRAVLKHRFKFLSFFAQLPSDQIVVEGELSVITSPRQPSGGVSEIFFSFYTNCEIHRDRSLCNVLIYTHRATHWETFESCRPRVDESSSRSERFLQRAPVRVIQCYSADSKSYGSKRDHDKKSWIIGRQS